MTEVPQSEAVERALDQTDQRISLRWHMRLWGEKFGNLEMVEVMVADPRIADKLDAFCHELVGVEQGQIDAATRDVLTAIREGEDVTLILGTALFAAAWSSAMFSGEASGAPAALMDDTLRIAQQLSQDAGDIVEITQTHEIQSVDVLREIGGAVIAGWVAVQKSARAAALQLYFDPDGSVNQPIEILNAEACSRLMQAFVTYQTGANDGV